MNVIKQNDGTVFTVDRNVCVDIDIPENVDTFIMGGGISSFHLRGIMKTFPQIRKIQIESQVEEIEISNFMFPNVRQVNGNSYSYNNGYRYSDDFFRTEPCLVWKYGSRNILLNAFCRRENEEVWLSGMYNFVIGDYALEGFRGRLTFPDEYTADARAFAGTEYTLRPYQDGVNMEGDVIMAVEPGLDSLVMPDGVRNVVADMNGLKKITVSSQEQVDALPYEISVDTVTLTGDFAPDRFPAGDIQAYEVVDNPYYCSRDGVIYSRNGERLVRFPASRTGSFEVPEGVKYIADGAFRKSCLTSVSFPDSLVNIGASSFQESEIENIRFGNGVYRLGTSPASYAYTFSQCKALKSVDIPGNVKEIGLGSFFLCTNLEEVTLHDGLAVIDRNVFSGCDKLKRISIPGTVCGLGNESLGQVEEVRLEGDYIPEGFFEAIFDVSSGSDSEYSGYSFVKIRWMEGEILIPKRIISTEMPNCRKLRCTGQLFTQSFIDKIPDLGENESVRQDLTLELWDTLSLPRQQERTAYFRKRSKKVMSRLIQQKKEKLLVKMVAMKIPSPGSIKACLEDLPADMGQARAAMLNGVGKSKKSFGL